MANDVTTEDLLYFNGVNGATGEYGLPPMTGTELSEFIQGEAEPENLAELRFRHEQKDQKHFGVKEGVDPKNLGEAGWGVIFAAKGEDVPAVKEALSPLLNLRQEQAGEYFKIYEGGDGYRPDESKAKFLARHGAGPGPADPEKVPYYLLIVGDPAAIPYGFQYQLDVQYAVGRIHFETPGEYANYAQSVVNTERGKVKLPRQLTFFGVANEGDKATNLGTEQLVAPLSDYFKEKHTDWQVNTFLKDQATKAQLARLIGGDQTPALLFSASHGMEFPLGDERQVPHQGALLCQDWPGPNAWRGKGAIPHDFYFAGDDLTNEAKLLGLLTFFFACYGAGTPLDDEFSKQAFKERKAIAPHAFLAGLPTKMLGHPRGGALATIGHVERAWGYSFLWPGAGRQTTVFESTLERLLDGHPIGSAIEYFDERYAELASDLSVELEEIEYGKQYNPYDLAGMWTANNDARSYIIIGDPAVRLSVAESKGVGIERPTITVAPFPPKAAPAPPTVPSAPPPMAELKADVDYGFRDTFKQAQTNISETMQGFAQKLSTFLSEAIENATSLEVATYTSENLTGVEYQEGKFVGPAELRALSRINVDGDTSLVVPVQEGEIDKELLAVHLEMVKQAQAGRNELIQTAVSAVASLASFWKPG
jgi:hypothetical protein